MVSSEAPEMLLKPGDHIAITCSREHYDEILNSVSVYVLCVCVRACVHTYVRACVRTCVCAYVRAYVCTCARMCVRMCGVCGYLVFTWEANALWCWGRCGTLGLTISLHETWTVLTSSAPGRFVYTRLKCLSDEALVCCIG